MLPILHSARLKHRSSVCKGFVMLCNSQVSDSLGHSCTDTETFCIVVIVTKPLPTAIIGIK